MMLKYLIQTSIFCYSKNYGSLTHETRIKDAVNMGDLVCLLATVRTLKMQVGHIQIILQDHVSLKIRNTSIKLAPAPGNS